MPYNMNDELELAAKEFGGSSGGNFYKIEEGNQNVVRVLTRGATYASQFMGQGNGFRTIYGKEKGDPLRSRDDSDAEKPGRLLSPLTKDGKESKASIRSVVYVIDRKDGRIKQAEFPYMVAKQIGNLQQNPDYQFDDMPMPYDIRITYKKDEAPMNMYRVEVKPASAEITEEQRKELEDRMTKYSPESVVQAKKNRQIEEDERYGRRIDPETLAKEAVDYNDNMRATAKKQLQESGEPVIQYDENSINPADIPF